MVIKELKDVHNGQDIWIIGAGSSMDFVDPSFFDNKICISVHTSIRSDHVDQITLE